MYLTSTLYTDPKYARKTCCRGEVSHVDSRSRLSVTLKHLAGSKMQDIERTHGVSRSTVSQAIRITVDAIIAEFPIPPFPFEDETALKDIANGFQSKSSGWVFANVVGAMDGYLLKISKRAIGKHSDIKDPSKYYSRKGCYSVNCQVNCDSNRKVRSVSMLCPGAVDRQIKHIINTLFVQI